MISQYGNIVNMGILITFLILLFSAIVHEVAHGLMAERLGDDTAREEGRITLNPIVHIDPFGSILLPLTLLAIGSPVILGAAKPVPVNFGNLRNPRSGMAWVSLAGPLSNFALAILFVILVKTGITNSVSYPILLQAIVINVVLGIFNLVPIPPLDGSKVVAAFAPREWMYTILRFEQYGFILIFLFLYAGLFEKIFIPAIIFFWNIFGLPAQDLIRTVTGGW